MLGERVVLAMSSVALASGCAQDARITPQSETQEIINNLQEAGFPRNDITVLGDAVYVGRDAEVSLAASREMVRTEETGKEQYHTTAGILVNSMAICLDPGALTGVFRDALVLAVQNYEEQPLRYQFRLGASTATCSQIIHAVMQAGLVGGSSGFPSGGMPFPTINIGDGLASFGIDVIEHVITHEIGHTLGLRHSDYFDRSISCGTGGDEGDAGVGAILIPGTPSGATAGGSIMNSCFRTNETGEFTASDITALTALFPARPPCPGESDCAQVCARDSWCESSCVNSECRCSVRPRRTPRGLECL